MTKPPISLDALRTLDAIVRRGSFAAAAEELFKVPSAITYAVNRLEEDLQVTLFDRSGPRPALTTVGLMVVEEGRHLLKGAEQLAEGARQLERGWETRLCIALDTAIPLALLHPVLERLDGLDADVGVEIRDESLGGCWDALVDGRADLAIGAVADICPPGRFETRSLGTIDHWMVASPGHPLAAASAPVPRTEIQRHRVVVVADSTRSLPPRTLGLTTDKRILVVTTMRQKYDAVAAGIGVGHLPVHWVREAVERTELVRISTVEEPPSVESLIAWCRGRSGRAAQWFTEQATATLTFEGALPPSRASNAESNQVEVPRG